MFDYEMLIAWTGTANVIKETGNFLRGLLLIVNFVFDQKYQQQIFDETSAILPLKSQK